jgi:5-methylcytosine-specific restriction protein A
MCLDAGLTRAAVVVDHIKPLALGGSDDDSNTRNLCGEHHLEVTAEQFDQRRPTIGVDSGGWPVERERQWRPTRDRQHR